MITHSYSHHVDHDEGDSDQLNICNYIDWNVFKAFKDYVDECNRKIKTFTNFLSRKFSFISIFPPLFSS